MPKTYLDDPVIDGTDAQQRDAVRFLARDNTIGSMRISDAEIAFALANEANVYMAAAAVAGMIVSQMTTRKKVGSTEIERDVEQFTTLVDELRARGSGHQVPYVGGLSKAEKDVDRSNDDNVKPFFRRDMNDSPGVEAPPTTPLSTDQ